MLEYVEYFKDIKRPDNINHQNSASKPVYNPQKHNLVPNLNLLLVFLTNLLFYNLQSELPNGSSLLFNL